MSQDTPPPGLGFFPGGSTSGMAEPSLSLVSTTPPPPQEKTQKPEPKKAKKAESVKDSGKEPKEANQDVEPLTPEKEILKSDEPTNVEKMVLALDDAKNVFESMVKDDKVKIRSSKTEILNICGKLAFAQHSFRTEMVAITFDKVMTYALIDVPRRTVRLYAFIPSVASEVLTAIFPLTGVNLKFSSDSFSRPNGF